MTSIKVTEAATVFRGEETVYHYDFPAVGILEGWAIPGIKQKLAELGGELELPIDGEHPAVAVLTEALASAEQVEQRERPGEAEIETTGDTSGDPFRKAPGDVLGEDPVPTDSTPTDPALGVIPYTRLRLSHTSEETSRFRLTWFHAVIAAVIMTVIAVSWWAIQFTTTQEVAPAGAAGSSLESSAGSSSNSGKASRLPSGSSAGATSPSADSSRSQEASSKTGGRQDSSSHTRQDPAPPESVLLETDLLRIHAPEGFQPVPENGGWVLSGEDSDLRIHLIVNRVFGVPPAEMFKEIRKTVESDPTLSEFTDPTDSTSKASYLENPGDGSQVRWVIWFSGDNEISVGCQTRSLPTLVQNAACSMVVDSTVLKAGSESSE